MKTHVAAACTVARTLSVSAGLLVGLAFCCPHADAQAINNAGPPGSSIIYKVRSASERLEMTVASSRILTLDEKIPQAQVNNPDILDVTALSPTQIQVSAKKAGVTQVNLWGEDKQIYTVDVIVFADARELQLLLESEFPKASIKVRPLANGVLISGYVDKPDHASEIIAIAEEYYPKVIPRITVGGVPQVLLHVEVMEVSRTKLRSLGFDWAKITGNDLYASSAAGLVSGFVQAQTGAVGQEQFTLQVLQSGSEFFAFLEALQQNDLLKVLAEPTLVTVSGRPAFFNVGGEFPIAVPQSLGTVAIEYKKYGTQVDFVPIVLGNGKIRLEVRPRVSEIDNSRNITIPGFTTVVPGLRVREVDTGVEMTAGQTLAIAGLVFERTEAQRRGLPWVHDLPYVGAAFGRVQNVTNEIEMLIMVTPELVDGMAYDEVPPCGPGTRTDNPTDCELFFKRHIEVPKCCPGGEGGYPGGWSQNGHAMPGMIVDDRPVHEASPHHPMRPQVMPLQDAPTTQPMPQSTPPRPTPQPHETSQRGFSRSGRPLPPHPAVAQGPIGRQAVHPAARPPQRTAQPPHIPSNPQRRSAYPTNTPPNAMPGFMGDIGYDE